MGRNDGSNDTGATRRRCPVSQHGHGLCVPSRRARVNCFAEGTLIATPRGEITVEALRPGDRAITRDNGPQEIRWVGRKRLAGPVLRVDDRLQPVVIRAGALGPGLPERDLRVSPSHRVLLVGDHPTLDSAEAEVFVSARHLVGTRGIGQDRVGAVIYHHIMCDRHEVVMSNGCWTESFRPTDTALQGVEDRAREELLELFPDLGADGATPDFAPARPTYGVEAIRKARA